MKKEFHAHPLMIIGLMKPFLFVLIFPLLKGVLQYIVDNEVTGVLRLEIIFFTAIAIAAFLRYKAFRLIVGKEKVIIEKGVIFKSHSVININKLSSVQAVQNPIDAIFRSVTYKINTEAGVIGKSDFEFKLSYKDSSEISERLFGKTAPKAVKFSVVKVAIMAATTSSAVTGIIVGVPIINRAGKLLGIAIDRMLLDEINYVSGKLHTYFPPIVNTVSLIILLAYAVSFIYSFLKYINFRLFLEDEKLEIRAGFFVRRRTAFKKSSVNNVIINQTPLMRIFRRYAMKVSVGGYGNSKSETAVVVPSGKYSDIKRQFSLYFPFLAPEGKLLHSGTDFITKSRFLLLPAIYFVLTATAAIVLSVVFADFTRFILFLTAVVGVSILYFAYLSLFEFHFGKLKMGKNIYARSRHFFDTCELYCPRENVGHIKIVRYPADITFKTCKVSIFVRSESADRIRLRFLKYSEVKSAILECYGVEV